MRTGPSDLEHQAGPAQHGPAPEPDQGRAGGRGPAGDLRQGVRRLARRPERDPTHRPARQRAGEPADVVGVQVRQHHEGQRPDPEAGEAAVDRARVGARVDEHRAARLAGGQHQGVALTDVARHQRPPRGRPPRRHDPGGHEHQQRADEHRRRPPRGAGATAARAPTSTTTAARASAPGTPPGHASVAPGTAAHRRATHTSHDTPGPASHTSASAPPDHHGATAAASTPSTVTGATIGAASRFATTATRLTSPDRPAITGAVTTWAATGTASASAIPGGTPRARHRATIPGASSTSAPVASTDSANPGSVAEPGVDEQQDDHRRAQRRHHRPPPTHREREHRDPAHHRRPQDAR